VKLRKILILVVVFTALLTTAIFASPGDSTDPIVVLSYLEQRLNNLVNSYKLDTIDSSIDSLQAKIDDLEDSVASGGNNSPSSNEFAIVEIKAGQKIICESGTELILRQGTAFVIGSDLGGISDVTKGSDIKDGKPIIANHFMLVPRSDGRGVTTADSALFMVRGAHEVK
jgi:hypothetical protein